MHCEQCGITGEGSFCALCGGRLVASTEPDPAGGFWAEDEATTAQPPAHPGVAGSTEYSGYPWAGGRQSPPPTPQKSTPWPLLVGAAVAVGALVLALGGGTLWFLTSDDDPAVATDPSSTSTPTSSITQSSSDPTTVTTTTTSTPSAEDQLGDTREESLTRLTTDDRWAVSLSAKQDGTRDDRQITSSGSHVFRLPDILELHETYASTYGSIGSIYLLRAEDLGSTEGPDDHRIWMTVLDPGGLTSREDAEQWCADEYAWLSGDDLDNACFPRQLSSP